MSHLVSIYGANSNLSPIQRASLSPEQIKSREFGSKMFMIGWFTYSGAVWTLKLCMMFFFSRVTLVFRVLLPRNKLTCEVLSDLDYGDKA